MHAGALALSPEPRVLPTIMEEHMITRSIMQMKDRLTDAEDRLALARARREPSPALVETLADEVGALREALWSLRRARASGFEDGRRA